MPGLRRIVEVQDRRVQSPADAGLMLTTSGVATPFGSVIDDGELNVPSLPTQLRLNVRGFDPPFERVIVYVRVYGVPTVTPSRS